MCGDSYETINHIISNCSKFVQKVFETRHDCAVNVIHWELCKKLKFDPTNKWHMHILESVLENETQKVFWDFDIQAGNRISAIWPDLVISQQKKRTCRIVDFAAPTDQRVKIKESEKGDMNLDLTRDWINYETWKWRWYQW